MWVTIRQIPSRTTTATRHINNMGCELDSVRDELGKMNSTTVWLIPLPQVVTKRFTVRILVPGI